MWGGSMKIALAQFNPVIGDFEGNVQRIISRIQSARELGCDLVVFPELSLIGYPPYDLLIQKDFIESCQKALEDLLPHTKGIGVLVGGVAAIEGSEKLFNSAFLLEDGKIIGQVNKNVLDDLDYIDDSRYFQEDKGTHCLEFRGLKLGVIISGDLWMDSKGSCIKYCPEDIFMKLYDQSPAMFINMAASPYHYTKQKMRADLASCMADKYHIPLLFVNQVGANDELIFDGSSMVFDSKGQLILHGKSFEEDIIVFDSNQNYNPIEEVREDISWIYKGLVLGMRDYFHKSGFKKALLGISGGIDSALVACIAAEALGRENVLGVSMPSRYSSEHSKNDARKLAENLGIEYREIPLEPFFREYIRAFNGTDQTLGDLAEENIQARIRASILMFISNREGKMLVCCSNKSEIAVGYSTLYGDSCGALAVIGDVLKTQVYELCRYINREREIIPENILIKAPSAELRPNQKDEDSLPPYSVLDDILQMYIEENASVIDMERKGYERQTIFRILNMIDRAEYKRRQLPPVLKITSKAFGLSRRMPIVQRFKWSE